MQLPAVAPTRFKLRQVPTMSEALELLVTMSAVVLRLADILAVDLSSSTAEIVPTPEDVDMVDLASFAEVAAFERKSALGWRYRIPPAARPIER